MTPELDALVLRCLAKRKEDRYRDAAAVSNDAVAAYYAENAERFRSEESLDVEYLELYIDDYREPVEEARLREEFELVRGEYELAEETRTYLTGVRSKALVNVGGESARHDEMLAERFRNSEFGIEN